MLEREGLIQRFLEVRAQTVALAAPLSVEDMLVQSMPDASPTKWHLAHTTWFFEEFVLARYADGHAWVDSRYRSLFNSYYLGVETPPARAERGLMSRPSSDEVAFWRAKLDAKMVEFLRRAPPDGLAAALLGTHHEQQHQELILTDAKHALSRNPLKPSYADLLPARAKTHETPPVGLVASRDRLAGGQTLSPTWREYPGATLHVGHAGEGFAFDNERPRHRVVVEPYRLARGLVTNAEYAQFIADRGYERPELWLSDGWSCARHAQWQRPLYWENDAEEFTLRGVAALRPCAPVLHVSYYEADAYARWFGARLPTEHEWEAAASGVPVQGNFVESGRLMPEARSGAPDEMTQLFGDAWEWTASAYSPYPRFRPLGGVLSEYNGKFMSGQMVLRGGSCLSPQDHLRSTYRNFFPPSARWQASGIRLAMDTHT